jgi:hypothetical protein
LQHLPNGLRRSGSGKAEANQGRKCETHKVLRSRIGLVARLNGPVPVGFPRSGFEWW